MDGAASIFHGLNRAKQGVTVDPADPADAGRLRAPILDRADVLLQNLRPGAAARYGLAAPGLVRAKPELICLDLGAFGAVGPLRDRPGYDPLIQAFGGLTSVTGEDWRHPVRVGISIIDMGAGMWGVIGVLAALAERARTGLGGVVETSLYETALAWMTVPIAGYRASGEVRRRQGSGTAEIVPYQVFTACDGDLTIAAGNDNLFSKLAAACGRAEWAADGRFGINTARVANRAALVSMIQDALMQRPVAHWRGCLDAAGLPHAPIQSVDQVVADPQTAALGMVQLPPGSGPSAGGLNLVGLPLRFDGVRPLYRQAAPGLREHNGAVFAAPVEER